jgi:hypothetical protein
MTPQEFILAFTSIAFILIFGYILLQNEFRCSYCGKYKICHLWYRKGMYLHPENILNVCNQCGEKHKEKFG